MPPKTYIECHKHTVNGVDFIELVQPGHTRVLMKPGVHFKSGESGFIYTPPTKSYWAIKEHKSPMWYVMYENTLVSRVPAYVYDTEDVIDIMCDFEKMKFRGLNRIPECMEVCH